MISPLVIFAFVALFFALLTQWVEITRRFWPWALGVSLLLAVLSKLIDPAGIVLPVIVIILWYLLKNNQTRLNTPAEIGIKTIVLFVCLALAFHAVPGFNNIPILDNIVVKAGAIPYSFWINYDKALSGVFLLAFFVDLEGVSKKVIEILKWGCIGITMLAILLFLPSMVAGFIRFDPGWPEFIVLWLISNLFITVLAEEAFFRGIIQQGLNNILQAKKVNHAAIIALIVASSIFAIAHIKGGVFFVIVSLVAGLVYGYVYLKSQRLESAILVHFLTNLIHLSLFSYPVLEKAG